MLTLLCRDIRGLYWISDVQEMSYWIHICSWCIVVQMLSKRDLLRGSLVIILSATYMMFSIVSSGEASNMAAYAPTGRVIP